MTYLWPTQYTRRRYLLLIALSYVSMVILMVGLLLDIFGLIFTRQIYSCADESGSQFTGTLYLLRLYKF